MRPGDEIFVEVPRTGGADTAILIEEDGDELVVILWNYTRRIPRSWMFDPKAINEGRD